MIDLSVVEDSLFTIAVRAPAAGAAGRHGAGFGRSGRGRNGTGSGAWCGTRLDSAGGGRYVALYSTALLTRRGSALVLATGGLTVGVAAVRIHRHWLGVVRPREGVGIRDGGAVGRGAVGEISDLAGFRAVTVQFHLWIRAVGYLRRRGPRASGRRSGDCEEKGEGPDDRAEKSRAPATRSWTHGSLPFCRVPRSCDLFDRIHHRRWAAMVAVGAAGRENAVGAGIVLRP